jgi:GWxTD domain-containing protein
VDDVIWKKEHFASSFEASTSTDINLMGAVTFTVDPGSYAFRLRFNDLNTERTSTSMLRPVQVPDFSEASIGDAIVADKVSSTDIVRVIELTNLGGNAAYSEEALAVLPLSLPSGTDLSTASLSYTLREVDAEALYKERRKRMEEAREYARREMERSQDRESDTPLIVERMEELEGRTDIFSGTVSGSDFLGIGPVSDAHVSAGRLNLVEAEGPTSTYLAVIDLKGPTLENGTYILSTTLKAGDETIENKTRIATHWRNMPYSLFDLDVALENMLFIVDKDELKAMRKGDPSEKLERFRAFWKERDPTPETAYNELMAEYYRRVDYAAVEYRTGADPSPDGLRSDRAKIYIVHGPPKDISRELPAGGGVLETWTYGDGRKFVFEAASSLDLFRIVGSQ